MLHFPFISRWKNHKRPLLLLLALCLCGLLAPTLIFVLGKNAPPSPAPASGSTALPTAPPTEKASLPPHTPSQPQPEALTLTPTLSPAPTPVQDFLEGAIPVSPPPAQNQEHQENQKTENFLIYDAALDKVLSISPAEFLPAALACEMDLSAPTEALKAQAVAIFTNYTREKQDGLKSHGGHFACDSKNWQIYVTKEEMEARWGEDFQENYALLESISNQVQGQLVLDSQGEPACTAFFAVSAGSTQPAQAVWGNPVPYLQTVASPGDAFSPGYLSEAVFTPEEFKTAVSQAFPDLHPDFSGDSSTWLTIDTRTPGGYVETASLGGCTVTGTELRAAFSLRSAAFSLDASQESLRFQVRGWGHGVGMSQAGACSLAQSGMSYREILAVYYPGTQLDTGAKTANPAKKIED